MRLVSFREDSTIASTAASDIGSTLMCDPDYLLARAIEKLPTYGFLFPRPRPSPYPVDHHLIMAPARFAVDEINKEKNANLHLVRVVAAFDRRSFEYFDWRCLMRAWPKFTEQKLKENPAAAI
ncbi:uncharacterized protein [Malus domestica]|uniref:uncharacterized protein n=1 Tax=Malus domestica TaxID=3750 RepID=UPI003975E186